MIEHYRDHAANERTYLAWIRTGITVLVLGFIVEKFDLFLIRLRGIVSARPGPQHHVAMAGEVSLALAVFGLMVIVAGTLRFFRIKAALDSPEGIRFRGSYYVLLLSLALVGFGFYLILYMRNSLFAV